VDQALFEEMFFGGREPGIGGTEKNYSAYVLLYERDDFLEALETSDRPSEMLVGTALPAMPTDTDAANPKEPELAKVDKTAGSSLQTRRNSQGSDSSSGSMRALASRVSALTLMSKQHRSALLDAVPHSIQARVTLANTQFHFTAHLYEDIFAAMLARLGHAAAVLASPAPEGGLELEPAPASASLESNAQLLLADSPEQPAPPVLAEHASGAAARLLARFYLHMYAHLQRRDGAIQVRQALLDLLGTSTAARAAVCHYLSEEPHMLKTCIFKARGEDVRQGVADLVLTALVGAEQPPSAHVFAKLDPVSADEQAGGAQRPLPTEASMEQQMTLVGELGEMLLTEGAENVQRGAVLMRLLCHFVAHGPTQTALAVAARLDVTLLSFLHLQAEEGGRRWSAHHLETFVAIHNALAHIVRSSDLRPFIQPAPWHRNLQEPQAAVVAAEEEAIHARAAMDRMNFNFFALPSGKPLPLSKELADALFGSGTWTEDLLTTLLPLESTAPLLRCLLWCNPLFSYKLLCRLLESLPHRSDYRTVLTTLQNMMCLADVLQHKRVEVSGVNGLAGLSRSGGVFAHLVPFVTVVSISLPSPFLES
jgi:hypothetical protein